MNVIVEMACRITSSMPPGRRAEATPNAALISSTMSAATTTTDSVIGSLVAMASVTGSLEKYEVPRSPWNAAPSQARYCW